MRFTTLYFTLFLASFVFLFSCENNASSDSIGGSSQNDNDLFVYKDGSNGVANVQGGAFRINFLKEIPENIDECNCMFSFSEKDFNNEKFVLANSLAVLLENDYVYINLNDEQMAFPRMEGDKENGSFLIRRWGKGDIEVILTTVQEETYTGSEPSLEEGKLELKYQGNTVQSLKLVGYCGC